MGEPTAQCSFRKHTIIMTFGRIRDVLTIHFPLGQPKDNYTNSYLKFH